MRVPREAWWIAALTLLAVVLAALLGGGDGAKEDGRLNRTSYSAAPYGLRALYLTLRELDYEVHRFHYQFSQQTLPAAGTLVIVDPMPVASTEWKALHKWIGEGNCALLVGHAAAPGLDWVARSGRPPDLSFEAPSPTTAQPTQPTYLAEGVRRLAVKSEWRLPLTDAEAETEKGPQEEPPFGVRRFGAPPAQAFLHHAAPVFDDRYGPVVAYASVGSGHVVLLASPWTLSNEGISHADNLVFALNALGAPEGGAIYFDEYHHGYGRNLLRAALPLPVKLGLAQILLGVLLVVYARSRRLGRAVPLDRGHRQRAEFLSTMTAVLQRGRATRLAVRSAREAAVRSLQAKLGLPIDVDRAALTLAVGRLNPEAAEKLEVALSDCEHALSGAEELGEGRAVALVRKLDEAVEAAKRI